jgi:VanZ family protein
MILKMPHEIYKGIGAQTSTDFSQRLFWYAMGYAFFVVYGSLLPFEPNGLSLHDAWVRFHEIRLLTLGVGSRADLMANLILYVPIGLLFMGALVGVSQLNFVRLLGTVSTALIVVGLALGIEFTQLFFPPRTVSLNDIYSECIGGLLGISVWLVAGRPILILWERFAKGGEPALQATLVLYTLVYFFLSLFPYDLLLSGSEWREHFASNKVGWLFAGGCGLTCIVKLIPETLAVIPIGVLIGRWHRGRKLSLFAALSIGVLLGATIEIAQLFIESGVTQGASILSRAIGVALGIRFVLRPTRFDFKSVTPFVRPVLRVAVVPYAFLLAGANHLLTSFWLSPSKAVGRIPSVHFIPFYYHYYTAEAVALVSAMFQVGLYSLLGFVVWLWCGIGRKKSVGRLAPALFGSVISCVIEIGKLFVPTQHPDPTNVLLAAFGTAAAISLLDWLFPYKIAENKSIKVLQNDE